MSNIDEIHSMLERELRYDLIRDVNGCWLFTGGSKNNFHGSLYYNGEPWQAHRLSYRLVCGPIADGLKVLHKCDVGMCVNPFHLFLGTQQDNIADMEAKGRANRSQQGSNNGRALLTEDQVIEIKYRLCHLTTTELCERYNVNRRVILKILNGQTWRHI